MAAIQWLPFNDTTLFLLVTQRIGIGEKPPLQSMPSSARTAVSPLNSSSPRMFVVCVPGTDKIPGTDFTSTSDTYHVLDYFTN